MSSSSPARTEAEAVRNSQAENPLNVLWVIPAIDASFGGPSTTAVNSVLAEAKSGVNVTLAFTATAEGKTALGPVLEELRLNGVDARVFPRASQKRWAGVWGVSFGLFRWLLGNVGRFDVLNLQYIWAATSLVGSIGAKLAGTPSILTAHESLTAYDINVTSNSQAKRMAKLALREIVLRCVTVVQFNSTLERRDSTVRGSPRIVINSFPVVENTGDARPVPESRAATFEVGFLGRLHPKKNVNISIRALSLLDEQFRLQIAGSGDSEEERAMLDLIGQLNLEDRVTWLGHVPRDDRTGFFSGVDVLAMPSTYESFGMVAAEAMSDGVPVISTPNAGIADLIEEFQAGIVLPEVSPESVAEAVAFLAENPELLARMSSAGIEAATRRLTFTSYARTMDELYGEMTGRAPLAH